MRYTILCLCLLSSLYSNAQDVAKNNDSCKPPVIFTYVDRMPSPKYNLSKYLAANIHYPEIARENNIEGRVIVKFVVDKKGRIGDCKIIKGIGGGCDEEALRVIENMPRWRPGKQKKPGTNKLRNVKVYFTQPITFNLE